MLNLIQDLPAYNKPYPKIGCGLIYCFEEDEFIEVAGVASSIDIVLNLFGIVSDGDILFLHGYKFTFVSGAPSNLQEISIGASTTDTATNLYNSIIKITFFLDNYIISNPAHEVILVNKKLLLDSAYFFSSSTLNIDAIILNPFGVQTAGVNPILKEDYYLFFDIIDAQTDEKLCSKPLELPLNIFSDYSTKVCADVQPIIEQYPKIFTSFPAPFAPAPTGTNKPDNFDYNYFRDFKLRFWNQYKDNSSTEDCEKVQSDFYELPSGSQLLRIANFVQKQDECSINGFSDYAFPPDNDFEQKFITSMPEEYKICQDTAFEFRFDYPVNTIDSLGGLVVFDYFITFTDGSNQVGSINWDTKEDGCQVLNISFGDGSGNETIIIPANQKMLSIRITVAHVLFATVFNFLEERTVYFETGSTNKVKCCEDKTHFYFLSCTGNNDVIIGKETQQTLETEFLSFCKEQTCCGSENYGVKTYAGGRVNTALESEQKIHKVLIETDAIQYLEEFLLSSFKYVYEPDKDRLFGIIPTRNSFTIWKKNFKTLIQFEFVKSQLRKRLKK